MRNLRKRTIGLLAVGAIMCVAPPELLAVEKSATPASTAPASGVSRLGKIRPPLSANEYVTLLPFVLPLVERNKSVRQQYTLVLALKLVDEDARDEVLRRVARIRHTLYPHLFRLISFRNRKPRLMSKAALRRALEPIALDVAGRKFVSELVVHKAFAARPPS